MSANQLSRLFKFSIITAIILIVIMIAYTVWSHWGLSQVDSSKILIYEIYSPSWVEQGGLRGMTEHLYRIKDLQPDYIWITPCYPSGGTDGGYDVTDYTAIDPALGTMDDFDEFVQTANSLGMKVLLDLVPNHTSDQHPWFQKSIAGDPKYADYYRWSDEDLGWGNMFDGTSAFTWNNDRCQYYMHAYHSSQPDLNWDNPAVIAEFNAIIDFWTHEHGVAGFRVDSAQLICEDFTPTILSRDTFGSFAGLAKYYTNPKTIKILHQLFDERDLFTMGELGAPIYPLFNSMVAPRGPLTGGINFVTSNAIDKHLGLIDADTDFSRADKALQKWARHPSCIMMTESHDQPRFTSRAGITPTESLELLFKYNPRIVCLYQGQELGLYNPELSNDIADYKDRQTIMRYESAVAAGTDPTEALTALKVGSRENARQPLPLDLYNTQAIDSDSYFHYLCHLITNWKNH